MVGAPAARRFALAASGVIGVVGLVYAVGARGAEWSITPTVGVSETFTDNANLATDAQDANSDFITQVSPSIAIRGTGARGNVSLDYALDQSFYHRGVLDDESNNSLAGTGQVELWRDVFFIDGQTSISQVVEDQRAATSNSVTGQNVNRTETRVYRVSPFLRHHFGPWVETEARYTYSGLSTETDIIEDSTTQSQEIRINSGRRFTQLLWSLTALNSKTANEGDQPSEHERRVDSDFTFVINRNVSLLAGLGYEDVVDEGLLSQPKGLTWKTGFDLRPGPRTTARVTVGDRNGEMSYFFEGTHILSPRTSIRASYDETIQTSQRLLTDNLNFLIRDPDTGALLDSRTLQPFDNDDPFGLTENTFRQKRFDISVSGSRRRNTFYAGLYWEERETESTGIEETAYGGSFTVSRQMSRRLNGALTLDYRMTDFGTADERTEDEIGATTSLSYRVRNDIYATLTYNLTLRKVNNAPDDLMENSVTVGLTKSF